MWDLYERDELEPDTELTGKFKGPEGKVDTEAVLDLIRAGTDSALDNARGRFLGKLSDKIYKIKEGLLATLARIEAELDFAEEDVELLPEGEIIKACTSAESGINELL